MTEHAQEQALKALRDANKFLLDLDRYDTHSAGIPGELVRDASRVRAEVAFAIQLGGKL